MSKEPRLRALVGTDIGKDRFEVGALIPNSVLTDKQRDYLLSEGYAEPEDVEVSALDPKAEEKAEEGQ